MTNQIPISMFILALYAQSSIQKWCLILYDCCSSKGKSNKTYCQESIYVHTVHMHYICEYEWMICWNLISKDSYKQFLRLHRYIASKGVPWRECVYVCSMYYTMYIIRWLGVWRKAVFNAYVLFVSTFFACLYIQILTAAVSSILYTRYQKRKL